MMWFPDALEYLRGGHAVTRTSWTLGEIIFVREVDGEPVITIEYPAGHPDRPHDILAEDRRSPWTAVSADLLAHDWKPA